MRLSKRIYKLAESVKSGDTVADIGTDHGYVPMLLIKENKSPHVIMSDISEGSLAKAKETFTVSGLMDRVSESDFRVGDGLETVKSGEVDEIIIAGLGGHTIVDILAADIEKSSSFKRLILQPRKHSGTLRYWLYTNGWDIRSDDLAHEGKFACEIIVATPTAEVFSSYREAPYPEDDIRWKYPESLKHADPMLAQNRVGWKIGSIREQIESLKRSGSDRKELIKSLEEDIEYLEKLL